ncbi:MAG: hypothetical protein AB9903_34230 [Vulcanimicrobiota bacterium]
MFVFSKNQNRRNLNSSQRSAVAVDFMPIFDKEAEERQIASRAKPGEKVGSKVGPNLDPPYEKGKTFDKVAKMMNVGHGTVGLAAKVKKRGTSELFDAVKTGKIPVSVASEISELPKEEQKKMVSAGDLTEMRAKAKEIEANITELEGDMAELAEIDENLIRNELHFIDRGEAIMRREEILKKIGLRAKAGENQFIGGHADSAPPKTTADIAKEIGVSKRVLQEDKQIAKSLLPELKTLTKEHKIPKRDALKYAAKTQEEQAKTEEIVISML